MPLYKYKAISQKGQVLEGYKEGQSVAEIVSFLKNNNYYPVTIEEDVDTAARRNFLSKKVTKRIYQYFVGNFIPCLMQEFLL